MKPIKLKIKAFICYANEQVIDFTKLGKNGLYLITGQTGAGKTAIFDAISYALYGEASGDARSKPEKLRSQFVDSKEKTVVDFDFVSGGKKYNICREIRPQINRESKEIAKLNESVAFTLHDGTILDREKEIKAKIEEIVGLDKGQFSQIVMIAQNDFLQFLQSGTDEKVNLLRRIFNTGHIKWFQERLKSMRKDADDSVQLIKRDFESRGVNLYERERVFSEWEEKIAYDEKQQEEIDRQIKLLGKEEKELAAAIAVAEGMIKLFKDLTDARNADTRHIELKDEIESLRIKKSRGEVVLYKVKPIADKYYAAKIENLKAGKELEQAETEAKNVKKVLDETAELLESLPPLEKSEADYAVIEKECISAGEKLEKLNTLKNQSDEFKSKEISLKTMQTEVENLQTAYNTAYKEYKDLYQCFIQSQAGLLARELKEGAACLVCGSTSHPKPAKITDESINEKELNRRQEIVDVTKNRLDKKALCCTGLKSEIKTLKDAFVKDIAKAVKDFDIDTAAEKLDAEIKVISDRYDILKQQRDAGRNALDKLRKDSAAAKQKQIDIDVAFAKVTALVSERKKRADETKNALDKASKEFHTIFTENGFMDEFDYQSAVISESEIERISKKISGYDESGKQIKRDIKRLEYETKDKQEPDIETLRIKEAAIAERSGQLKNQHDEILASSGKLKDNLKVLKNSEKEFVKAERRLLVAKSLSDIANGKLDFETYAQIAYFERVLKAANLRLKTMSQNRYILARKSDEGDRRQRTGLEIDVFDTHTGKYRSVDSLSGGESFLASLSLALGLSDVVQQSAGSVHIDAMFIDEGFGSLDAEVLDLSIKTLSDMADNRVIGIISHVSELKERIDKRIDVEKTPTGSSISLMV